MLKKNHDCHLSAKDGFKDIRTWLIKQPRAEHRLQDEPKRDVQKTIIQWFCESHHLWSDKSNEFDARIFAIEKAMLEAKMAGVKDDDIIAITLLSIAGHNSSIQT